MTKFLVYFRELHFLGTSQTNGYSATWMHSQSSAEACCKWSIFFWGLKPNSKPFWYIFLFPQAHHMTLQDFFCSWSSPTLGRPWGCREWHWYQQWYLLKYTIIEGRTMETSPKGGRQWHPVCIIWPQSTKLNDTGCHLSQRLRTSCSEKQYCKGLWKKSSPSAFTVCSLLQNRCTLKNHELHF